MLSWPAVVTAPDTPPLISVSVTPRGATTADPFRIDTSPLSTGCRNVPAAVRFVASRPESFRSALNIF